MERESWPGAWKASWYEGELMKDTTGRKGTPGLCILGRPEKTNRESTLGGFAVHSA